MSNGNMFEYKEFCVAALLACAQRSVQTCPFASERCVGGVSERRLHWQRFYGMVVIGIKPKNRRSAVVVSCKVWSCVQHLLVSYRERAKYKLPNPTRPTRYFFGCRHPKRSVPHHPPNLGGGGSGGGIREESYLG